LAEVTRSLGSLVTLTQHERDGDQAEAHKAADMHFSRFLCLCPATGEELIYAGNHWLANGRLSNRRGTGIQGAMSQSEQDPTVFDLFAGFFMVGVCGFGGVLPWARRMIVEQRKWLSPMEFTDMLGLCQFLPGGNIMNVTIALGSRFRGVAGATAAFLGLMTAPVAIVIGLGVIYDQYADLPPVRRAFVALAAAAAAYLFANAWKIAAPLRGRPLAIVIVVLTVTAIAVLRLPLPAVLPVLALTSTILLWRFRA
jgi:chromate transporter